MKKLIIAAILFALASCNGIVSDSTSTGSDNVTLIIVSYFDSRICDYVWVQDLAGNVISITSRGEKDTVAVSKYRNVKIEYRYECTYNRTRQIYWTANNDTTIEIR